MNGCSLCCRAQYVVCLFHSVSLCPGWTYLGTVVSSQSLFLHLGQASSPSPRNHPLFPTNMADKREPPFFNDNNLGVVNYKLPFYETMELFIETLTGTCFQLRVSPFETIISVKAKIQRLEGIVPNSVLLFLSFFCKIIKTFWVELWYNVFIIRT